MPFIEQKDRLRASSEPVTEGEMSYATALVFKDMIHHLGLRWKTINRILTLAEKAKQNKFDKKDRYAVQLQKLVKFYVKNVGDDEWIGAIEGAKLEFYFPLAKDYETMKRMQNGAV